MTPRPARNRATSAEPQPRDPAPRNLPDQPATGRNHAVRNSPDQPATGRSFVLEAPR